MRVPTLVVDDQPDVRFLLRLLIDKANDGLVVIGEASSGRDALTQADEMDPLVIVLDEMMPGMSGLETVDQLRRRRPQQVIILCSAYLDDELLEKAREAGVVHCISKDDVSDLPALIRRAVAAS
jgi:CheY-like chemotaxis protein